MIKVVKNNEKKVDGIKWERIRNEDDGEKRKGKERERDGDERSKKSKRRVMEREGRE